MLGDAISVALGIISGSTVAHARRRKAIRESWLQFEPRGVAIRFVLRCADDDRLVEHSFDTVCAPLGESCNSAGCRSRGVILALVFWLRHAVATWPNVSFVAKADDDVYLQLPVWEHLLLSIPQPLQSHAVLGSIRFFHAVLAPRRFELRAYAPTYPYALMTARRLQLRQTACSGDAGTNESLVATASATMGCEVIGPFPYPCGQAFALGSGLVRSLIAHPIFHAEMRRVAALPEGSPLVTEDGWLGAVLHRCFATSTTTVSRESPETLQLFSLAGSNHLFVDPTDYRLITTRSAIVYHNRNTAPNPLPRWYKRMPLLYRFAKAAHCNATDGWSERSRPCCASKRQRARRRHAPEKHPAGTVPGTTHDPELERVSVRETQTTEAAPRWPLYQVEARPGACPDGDAHTRYDLGDRAVLDRWKVKARP